MQFDTLQTALFLIPVVASIVALMGLRRRSGKAIAEPTCARCEYVVRGLPSETCPECGADLSIAGAIVPPGTREPTHLALLALLALGIVAPLAWLATPTIVRLLPTQHSQGEMLELTPASRVFVGVDIFHEGFGFFPGPGTIKLVLDPPSRVNAIMEVDPTAARCRYPGQNWKTVETPFDANAILAMMRTTGIDTSHAAAIEDAGRMESIVRDISNGRIPQPRAGWSASHVNRWSRGYRPAWYWVGSFAAWTFVGIQLFRFCVRRRW